MSASLVGSEMCIRDRKARRLQRQARRLEGVQTSSEFAPGAGLFRFCAVSYTHLTLPTICSV
eukprot:6107678-Alexandrium_andersonii.AAC.1